MRRSSFLVFSCLLLLNSTKVLAYGTGLSSYPLMLDKKKISTEVTGITSTGGGMGIQGRYTQKISPSALFDAGFGVGSGERDSRLFAGFDYEWFPDYGNQPKITTKISFENAKEFDVRRNILSVTPTISKGFSFWGKEAYPFFALPIGLNLNGENNTYQTQFNASFGMSGHLPFEDYKKFVGTIEATVGMKDSFTGVFFGLAYPLN